MPSILKRLGLRKKTKTPPSRNFASSSTTTPASSSLKVRVSASGNGSSSLSHKPGKNVPLHREYPDSEDDLTHVMQESSSADTTTAPPAMMSPIIDAATTTNKTDSSAAARSTGHSHSKKDRHFFSLHRHHHNHASQSDDKKARASRSKSPSSERAAVGGGLLRGRLSRSKSPAPERSMMEVNNTSTGTEVGSFRRRISRSKSPSSERNTVPDPFVSYNISGKRRKPKDVPVEEMQHQQSQQQHQQNSHNSHNTNIPSTPATVETADTSFSADSPPPSPKSSLRRHNAIPRQVSTTRIQLEASSSTEEDPKNQASERVRRLIKPRNLAISTEPPSGSPPSSPKTAVATPESSVKSQKNIKSSLRNGGSSIRSSPKNGDLGLAPSASGEKKDQRRATPPTGNAISKSQAQRHREREKIRIARAAAALDNKGNKLFERGQYDKAMETYTKALKLKKRTFHAMLEEADDYLENALDEDNEVLQDEKTDPQMLVSMATSINNIGYLRQRSGAATPDETMAAYKKSLRIKQKVLGKDHLSVGKTLNNIGSVFYLKRDFDGALASYTEAMEIMNANLGAQHPDVATVWSNIGDVHLGKRNLEGALQNYRYALTIRWQLFGERDPRTIRLLEKIAAIEVGESMMEQTRQSITQSDAQYYGEDMELMDLGMQPFAVELKQLHEEVEADVLYVDSMERKMSIDMLKDKVTIFRGMREMEAEFQRSRDSSRSLQSHQRDESERSEDAINHVDSTASEGSEPLPFQSRNPERAAALQNVRDRLAKLRSEREALSGEKTARTSIGESKDGTVTSATRSLNSSQGSISYSPKPSLTVSRLKGGNYKDAADSVKSALKLKRGIESLRSLPLNETKTSEDDSAQKQELAQFYQRLVQA